MLCSFAPYAQIRMNYGSESSGSFYIETKKQITAFCADGKQLPDHSRAVQVLTQFAKENGFEFLPSAVAELRFDDLLVPSYGGWAQREVLDLVFPYEP